MENALEELLGNLDHITKEVAPQAKLASWTRFLYSRKPGDLLPFYDDKDQIRDQFHNDLSKPDSFLSRLGKAGVPADKFLEPIRKRILTIAEEMQEDAARQRAQAEADLAQVRRENDELKSDLDSLEAEKAQGSAKAVSVRKPLVSLGVLALLAVLFLSWWAIRATPTRQTTVSIEYNIAELIAAILGGTGAAAAGLAYAAKSLSPGPAGPRTE